MKSLTLYSVLYSFVGRRRRERERGKGGGGVCLAKHIKICAVVMITEILCAYYEMCNCI